MENTSYYYSYDFYMIYIALNSCLFGTYTAINILQNVRFVDSEKLSGFLLFMSSFCIAVMGVWTQHFILLNAMVFNKIRLKVNVLITFATLIIAVILYYIGVLMSYRPFMNRVIKNFNSHAVLKDNEEKNSVYIWINKFNKKL